MKTVVVVGGGFSGVVTAVNLARLTDTPLAVTVLNADRPAGRGVAYGTRRPEHLLNVVARNMSALADQPEHFIEWLGTRSDFADVPPAELRESFVPRRVYGDYLQALFLWYARSFADGKKVRIDSHTATVTDVEPRGDGARVRTADGRTFDADKVVLATGNPPPVDLPGLSLDHPMYFRDPWGDWESRLPDPSRDVAILGTGLTTVDAFLTLRAMNWRGRIFAVSRNGLLPQSHFKAPDYPDFPGDDPTGLGLDRLRTLFESHCGRLRERGLNPAVLVDKMRPFTQRVWQNLSVPEKRRFLTEFRTPWNVTRHRVAGSIHHELTAAIAAGKLEVVAGRITELSACEGGLKVVAGGRELRVGAVVNCTGPAEESAGSELYRNLLCRGLVSADDLGLGVRAGADFAAIDSSGARSPWLMVLGPPLKGVLWETTAVPELRAQAFRVAEVVIADLHANRAAVREVEELYADVLEYSI